jgi:hypothetical protein
MNSLTKDSYLAFLDRFCGGSDGVIRSFTITFRYRLQKETSGIVCISVKDIQCEENEGWVNLVIELNDIVEFTMRESTISYQVISSEIHILESDGLLYIDFGGCVEQPSSVNEIRKSEFYCASKLASWRLEPYRD